MHYFRALPVWLLLAASTLAQAPLDETARLRAVSLGRRFPREVPTAFPEVRSISWQIQTPKSFKRSLKIPLAAEVKLDPRLATNDRGHIERQQPATEQLALGLNVDPPRPQYPILAAEPRSTGPSLSAFEVIQLPPLSRTSDAKLTLNGDPATVATRPYTSPVATASRGAAPPRSDIGIPDPFVVQREAKLPVIPPDSDPPAVSFSVPERPVLPLTAAK